MTGLVLVPWLALAAPLTAQTLFLSGAKAPFQPGP
jgi:hypothetical protein